MFFYRAVCDFQGFKISHCKAYTLDRWGGKQNHLSLAYSLGNNATKNYWNRTTIFTVEVISGGWVVYFFAIKCIPVKDDTVAENWAKS